MNIRPLYSRIHWKDCAPSNRYQSKAAIESAWSSGPTDEIATLSGQIAEFQAWFEGAKPRCLLKFEVWLREPNLLNEAWRRQPEAIAFFENFREFVQDGTNRTLACDQYRTYSRRGDVWPTQLGRGSEAAASSYYSIAETDLVTEICEFIPTSAMISCLIRYYKTPRAPHVRYCGPPDDSGHAHTAPPPNDRSRSMTLVQELPERSGDDGYYSYVFSPHTLLRIPSPPFPRICPCNSAKRISISDVSLAHLGLYFMRVVLLSPLIVYECVERCAEVDV